MSTATWTARTRLVLGDGVDRLARSGVAVFGLGGVGSYVAEALARAGVGRLVLVDSDRVSETNRNRQLPALVSTVGQYKTEVMAARIRDIHPACAVTVMTRRLEPADTEWVGALAVDYIADAIDSVAAKTALIVTAQAAGIPLISAMGTGNKCHPEQLEIADIYATEVCPLARVMRRELRRRGIVSQQVVYSREVPRKPVFAPGEETVPGSVSFVPSVAGLLMAGVICRRLAGIEAKGEV